MPQLGFKVLCEYVAGVDMRKNSLLASRVLSNQIRPQFQKERMNEIKTKTKKERYTSKTEKRK